MSTPDDRKPSCAVDAELFDSLEDAIAFVAERGGGRVHTDLVGSLLAEIIAVPASVELVPPRGMVMKPMQNDPPES
ncbi:MAG: hypothetical protein HC871_00820 [Rhizobiales bacterium]|nr:hypothetical protein [Hyphomicrobiales bacterium]